MKETIIFDKETTIFILEALNLSVDTIGYIIDNNGIFVLDKYHSHPIKIDDVAGFFMGKIVRNSLYSMMELSKEIKELKAT
jgi:hypothetical protein